MFEVSGQLTAAVKFSSVGACAIGKEDDVLPFGERHLVLDLANLTCFKLSGRLAD